MPERNIPVRVKPDPIDNTELVAQFRASGGQIVHIRPRNGNRGITFAFVQTGRRMQIATAVQHNSDDFTKKIGTKTAIEHFLEGKTIFLPISKGKTGLSMLYWLMWG